MSRIYGKIRCNDFLNEYGDRMYEIVQKDQKITLTQSEWDVVVGNNHANKIQKPKKTEESYQLKRIGDYLDSMYALQLVQLTPEQINKAGDLIIGKKK